VGRVFGMGEFDGAAGGSPLSAVGWWMRRAQAAGLVLRVGGPFGSIDHDTPAQGLRMADGRFACWGVLGGVRCLLSFVTGAARSCCVESGA